MKGLYTVLFVIFIQTCLNSSEDGYVLSIPEDNQLTVVDCHQGKYYGFAFLATTSGFGDGSSFTFYCDAPGYNQFDCDVPESKDGKLQTISCWAKAEIFPLLDRSNVVVLPRSLSYPNIQIEGWENLKKELLFDFCSPLIPSHTFIIYEPFTAQCDLNNNNIISTYGSFISNLEYKRFLLTSTEDDYISYTFEPYLIVDGKLAKAYCTITVLLFEDEDDEELQCVLYGESSGIFFNTVAVSNVMDGPNQRVIGIKSSKPFYLKQC